MAYRKRKYYSRKRTYGSRRRKKRGNQKRLRSYRISRGGIRL